MALALSCMVQCHVGILSALVCIRSEFARPYGRARQYCKSQPRNVSSRINAMLKVRQTAGCRRNMCMLSSSTKATVYMRSLVNSCLNSAQVALDYSTSYACLDVLNSTLRLPVLHTKIKNKRQLYQKSV
eukprot:IDg12704t1